MPVVPEVWVMTAASSSGRSTGRTRGAPASSPSETAPGRSAAEVMTRRVMSASGTPSRRSSLRPSVSRVGRPTRSSRTPTVVASRAGERLTTTAPIRETAAASIQWSALAVL